jgi:uncharacterized protein YceK
MGKHPKYLFLVCIVLMIALYFTPVQAQTIVPLGPAGTPFDASKYAQDTPESDPMEFPCNWDGTGQVYMSGSNSSITGIYADDGYTVTVQPASTVFDAEEHWAHQHPVIELTSAMKKGLNKFTVVVQNWQGLSMSYGEGNGGAIPEGVEQTPYIVQMVADPIPRVIPLCPAGTPFNASKYAQDTPESDPMEFQCNWDGTGRVYMSGSNSSITGIYADDGYTVTVQPASTVFDAEEHWAHQHPVVELTGGLNPGQNSCTLVVQNWCGLSMSYGSINGVGTDQIPYLVQVIP